MRSFIYYLLSGLNPVSFISNKNSLRVLAYHTVDDQKIFEQQLKYLKSNYSLINISQLKNHLFNGDKLPKKPLLITFDDGDFSVLEKGFPLLKKYRIPSVLFIISSLIDSSNTFWCRWVERAFRNEGKTYAEARAKVNHLKKIPNQERVNYLTSLKEVKSRQLTSYELQVMEQKGMYIGNHTHTHPMMDRCEVQEIEKEMDEVNRRFKKWRLEGYPIFAYPNGNWDERTERILKEKGIEMAFVFDHKLNNTRIDPMRISRIMVDADTEINEFKVKVAGTHTNLLKLKDKLPF